MNYVWEALLLAEESGVKEEQVVFVQASAINPYLETAFEDLNLKGLENACVPVNPLYRFGPVFSALIGEQFDRFSASRGFLIDVLFHFLAQMDLMDGMSRLEYHRKFMQKEVVNGRYGKGTGEIPQRRTRISNKAHCSLWGVSLSHFTTQNNERIQ